MFNKLYKFFLSFLIDFFELQEVNPILKNWSTADAILHSFLSLSIIQGVTKSCRLSLLTNSALVNAVQMRGEGGTCGVSANDYSCAHHVTWSPNKLWRSNSIFNLWYYLTQGRATGEWAKLPSVCIRRRAKPAFFDRLPKLSYKNEPADPLRSRN